MRLRSSNGQRGATLVIALIMLVLLTLFALSAMNTSNISLKIANNMQTRNDAFNAAQQIIERLLSFDFTKNPAGVAAAIPKAVDVNNDGTPDYNVALATPVCIGVIPIPTAQLDIAKAQDAPCFGSSVPVTPGMIKGAKVVGSGGASLCSDSKWETNATATDPTSGASVTVHQGVGVRVVVGSAC